MAGGPALAASRTSFGRTGCCAAAENIREERARAARERILLCYLAALGNAIDSASTELIRSCGAECNRAHVRSLAVHRDGYIHLAGACHARRQEHVDLIEASKSAAGQSTTAYTSCR